MIVIEFPRYVNQYHYNQHYRYIFNIFNFLSEDFHIVFSDNIPIIEKYHKIDRKSKLYVQETFSIRVNGNICHFNIYDDCEFFSSDGNNELADTTDTIFKYHYGSDTEFSENVIPFCPISFLNWPDYFRCVCNIKYSNKSHMILNNQKAYGNAIERRRRVRQGLENTYGKKVDFKLCSQLKYFNKIRDCLVSVCVPGFSNNLLDRGQFQYMALGCCTISPRLPEVLPFFSDIIPGTHYIQCADDYSDLHEKIDWCNDNRITCEKISFSAKQLFEDCCTPDKLAQWVVENV